MCKTEEIKLSTKMLSLFTVLQVAIVWLPFSSAQETLPNLAVLLKLSDYLVSGHMCMNVIGMSNVSY